MSVIGVSTLLGDLRMKNIIADCLIMGMSVALLWHFSNIWRYGQYLIQEPNSVVLVLETAGLLAVLIFGVTKFISDLRSDLKGKSG